MKITFHFIPQKNSSRIWSLKKRYIRAPQKDIIDKELNQTLVLKSKLRNKFLGLKTEENRVAFVRERDYYASMLHWKIKRMSWQIKYKFYNWQQVVLENCVPLFSDRKLSKSSKITLLEKGEIVTDDAKIVI